MILDTTVIDVVRENEIGIYDTVRTDTVKYVIDQGNKFYVLTIDGYEYWIHYPKEKFFVRKGK